MKKVLLLLMLLEFTPSEARGQLTLPAAFKRPVEQALQRSREIANRQLELKKGSLERKSVASRHIPRINAVAGYAYFDNHVRVDLPGYQLPVSGAELFSGKTKIDNHGNLAHAGVTATGIVYAGGQIQNALKALDEKAIGDSLMTETDKDNLIIEIVISFDQLKYIEASEKLIEDSNKRLLKEEERVNKAVANGLAIPFDRDKIKLATLELASKKTQLEETKNLLYQKLNYLTGMSSRQLADVTYHLEPIVLHDQLHVDNRQELEALKYYRNAGKFLLKKEKGSFLPQVIAFGGVSYSSLFNGSSAFNIPNLPPQISQPNLKLNQFTVAPNWIGGIGLRWELFGGSERSNKVKEAELSITQLENRLEDSREKLNLLLEQKMVSYHSQWKQIDLAAQKQIVAQNNLTLAAKQYQQGLISVTQRLEAENDFVKAEQNKTEVLVAERQAALEAIGVTGKLTEKIQYQ